MKKNILFVLFLFLISGLNAQTNENLLQILHNNYSSQQAWVETQLAQMSNQEKFGLYFILDGRKNTISKNIEMLKENKPAGLLTNIKSLETFAKDVNLCNSLSAGSLIAIDAGQKIGLPSTDALVYPDFETVGAVKSLSSLIETGNDLAEQMSRIGADILFTDNTHVSKYDVVTQKMESFQKGLWFKNRFMLFYQNQISISSRYLTAKDLKEKTDLFFVTDNLTDAVEKVKSAFNFGQITQADLDKQARLALQVKHKTKVFEKSEINLKLIKEDINQRKFKHRINELYANAMTLVRNPDHFIPLLVEETERLKIACIAFGDTSVTAFQKKVKRYCEPKIYSFSENDSIEQFYAIETELDKFDAVFFEVYPLENGQELPKSWGMFIEKINHILPIVVTIFGKPEYLQQLKRLPSYKTVILTYQNNSTTGEAAAEIIFGEKPSTGTLAYTAGFPYNANDSKELINTKRFVPKTAKLNPKYELRAAWVATVMNIDFPSKAGLSSGELQLEITKMLDMHQRNNINAIIFQVSPSADAFYPSKILPWSQWLMGKSGDAPNSDFDPVAFLVDECHKRNIEFHAWFNPYRVKVKLETTMSIHHASNRHKDLMLTYGNKMYFDPGYEKTRQIVTAAVMELVHKYDVDGVHFDDYFYPYKIAGEEFPDTLSFETEARGFAKNQKEDWRRENVDLIIEMLHDSIKAAKPWIKFGISPFGVWRNRTEDASGSDTKAGVTNYDDLYADVMLWLQKGWIDYIMPQVYWERGKQNADFDKIVDWWSKNNYEKPVYIGHGIYKTDKNSTTEAWRNVSEIPSQIQLVRTYPEINGSAFFTTNTFVENPMSVVDIIKQELYKYRALPPTMPLIDNQKPEIPQNLIAKKIKKKKMMLLTWQNTSTTEEMDKVKYYMIYKFDGKTIGDISRPENFFLLTQKNELEVPVVNKFFKRTEVTYIITAFDRMHNESEPAIIILKL